MFIIGGIEVTNCSYERNFLAVIDESLDYSRQFAVLSAIRVIGIITRTYSCKGKDNILGFCKLLVLPLPDYCCQAWRPYLQKHVYNIEKVQ